MARLLMGLPVSLQSAPARSRLTLYEQLWVSTPGLALIQVPMICLLLLVLLCPMAVLCLHIGRDSALTLSEGQPEAPAESVLFPKPSPQSDLPLQARPGQWRTRPKVVQYGQ